MWAVTSLKIDSHYGKEIAKLLIQNDADVHARDMEQLVTIFGKEGAAGLLTGRDTENAAAPYQDLIL